MSSHYLPELKNMKSKLSKLLGDPSSQEEAINDLLSAIERMPLTASLIVESGLGPVVKLISKKFSVDNSLHKRSIETLKSWKSIIETSKVESSTTTSSAKAKPSKPSVAPITPHIISAPINSMQNDGRRSALSSDRLAIFQTFLAAFKLDVIEAEAEQIALDIEETLYKSCNDKEYSTKARTLMFNMKKNEALRRNIESKEVSPGQLLTMTPAQLASKEVKEARAKMLDQDLDGRRTNWLDEHKAEIQKDLGIDPNNDWDYDHGEDGLSEPDVDPPDL